MKGGAPNMRSALDHAPFHPLISDIAWLLTGKISQINREIAGDLNLLTTYKPLTFREALFFLLTADRIPGYTAPVEPSNERKINGAYIENPPRIQADGEAPEEMADILHYLADVHRFGQSTKEGTTKHAKETIRQLTAAIDVNEDWMLKKQEFTSLTVHDTLSEVGYRRDKGSAASQAGENDEFFDAVKRELLNSRQDLSYVDEKGNEVKLLEFRLVSEQSHTTVLKSIVNLVDFAVRQGPLVPYESIAQQLRIRTPGISRPQVQSFLEVALKWSRSSLDPVSVAAVAEQLVAAGAKIDADLKQLIEILTSLVKNNVSREVMVQLSLLLDQGQLTPQQIPVLVETMRDVVKSQANLAVLANLARMATTANLTPADLFDAQSRVDARLRQDRQIKDLEAQLEQERAHTEMKDALQRALAALPDQDKATAQAALEVLRSTDFLSRISLFRDMAIWMSQQTAPIKSPDELWAYIKRFSDVQSELALLKKQGDVDKTLRDLLRLLDDNLLQPKQTLQLLRSLLSDPDTANLGDVANTIQRLKQRNSELSLSFRQTLAAMGSLLQIFQSVSKQYAFRVLEFVRGLSSKVVDTTRAWGLPADNSVAQLANKLTDTFASNYYVVEVKADQKNDFKTLELTFAGQDLTNDAVFLHSASLFRWLDRFAVDPKRPADNDMAKLWDQAAELLFDWQETVIKTFSNTDVAGQGQAVSAAIVKGLLDAGNQFSLRVNDALGQTTKIAQSALDRFGKDLVKQEERLNRRVQSLLVTPALGQYVLTVNGQNQEAARALFKSFIDATRTQLLDGNNDEVKSTEWVAKIDTLALDMSRLKFEANVKDSEYKKLQSEHKALETKYDALEKASDASTKKIRDAESSLITYATKTGVTLKPGLDEDIKRLLDFYEDTRQEFIKTRGLVSVLANKYQVSVPGGIVLLSAEMKAVLDIFAAKYDNWTAASQKLRALSAGKLFPGGHQPTADLEKDAEVVLNAFRQTLSDWEKVQKLVSNYSLLVFESNVNATGVLEVDTKAALDAYERYRQDFIALRDEENKWWTRVQDARFPVTRSLTDDERVEQKGANTLLSGTTGVLSLLAQRRDIVANWIGTLAKLIEENDHWNVKDLIAKAQGKPGSSSSASKPAAASASANPYYRVQFNGEVDTLTKDHIFPVFLRQTPFMRLWMFAREFAGAASNQLGNILEPLAPGLEIDDERTLFILRQYQTDLKGKETANPPLPTGANKAEIARQELASEDKKDLKETAEARLKVQKDTAFDYIRQLDEYKNLSEYEIKVRQYFKNIALNALVHCQEMLQRTDLPEFRRITLAELINSPNLSSGFARMCGLYTLIKQGTVPGMIR